MGKFSHGRINEHKSEKYSPEFVLLTIFLVIQLIMKWYMQIFDDGFNAEFSPLYVVQLSLAVMLLILGIFHITKLLKCGEREYSIKITLPDICLIGMGIVGIFSTFHAIDRNTALWGTIGRHEGIYVLLCYYILFFTASYIKKQEEKRKLLLIICGIGCFGSFMGVLSGQGLLNGITEAWDNVAAIPYGNPNFFGTFVCMALSGAMGLYIYGDKKSIRIFGVIAFVIASLATFSCDSSSPLVGNIMVFLAVFVMEIYIWIKHKDKTKAKKRLCRWGICLLLYVVSLVCINVTRGGSVLQEFNRNMNYSDEGIGSDKMFSNRMGVWKYALGQVPDNWYLGIGVDNFGILTSEEDTPEKFVTFDKVHNEYIQILITEGVFSILFYLVFLFFLFFHGLKRWGKNEKLQLVVPLFLMFFGYIAQAFFNIREIDVAPIFWIACGLLYERK